MCKAIARFTIFLFVVLAFPLNIYAANYGEGNYGLGLYNVGEVTSAPVQSSSNNSPSATTTNNNTVPVCTDTVPATPNLFQVDIKGTSAKLFFTPLSTTNKYYISFSTKTSAEEHGVEVLLAREGVQNFTINSLKQNTIYYFKVRGQNGCMPGGWSQIVKATSGKVSTSQKISYYLGSLKSKVTSIISYFKTPEVKSNVAVVTVTTVASPSVVKTTIPTPMPTKKQTCFLWWCF